MKKIYKKLTAEQKARNVVFASTLSKYNFETSDDTTHEVTADDEERWTKIERLKDDKFFRNSHFKFNIIRR
jgi:hypothetical protein